MTDKVEVLYFIKPCPHCGHPLTRIEKMSMAWSECGNEKCSFLLNQPVHRPFPNRFPDMISDPVPYTECRNRR